MFRNLYVQFSIKVVFVDVQNLQMYRWAVTFDLFDHMGDDALLDLHVILSLVGLVKL